jgi:hypothetical protein
MYIDLSTKSNCNVLRNTCHTNSYTTDGVRSVNRLTVNNTNSPKSTTCPLDVNNRNLWAIFLFIYLSYFRCACKRYVFILFLSRSVWPTSWKNPVLRHSNDDGSFHFIIYIYFFGAAKGLKQANYRNQIGEHITICTALNESEPNRFNIDIVEATKIQASALYSAVCLSKKNNKPQPFIGKCSFLYLINIVYLYTTQAHITR